MFEKLKFQIKYGSILCCLFIVIASLRVNAIDWCNTDLCRPGQTHVACNNSGSFGKSCRNPKQIHITLDLQKLIVQQHNDARQKIASGNVPNYLPAQRMSLVTYSTDLVYMACMNAFSCIYAHDVCRNTELHPRSGQNLYIRCSTHQNTDIKTFITNGTQAWFNEYKLCDMSYIDKFHKFIDPSREIGHFTQMVRDKAQSVGCCITQYDDEDGASCQYFVCNYGAVNMDDWPIYRSGKPGSSCTTGCDKAYSALCSSKEEYLDDAIEIHEANQAALAKAKATAKSSATASAKSSTNSSGQKATAKASATASAKASAKPSGQKVAAKASATASAKASAKPSGQKPTAKASTTASAKASAKQKGSSKAHAPAHA